MILFVIAWCLRKASFSYAKYYSSCGNIIVNNSCIQEESMNADDDNIIQSIIKR